MQKFAVILSACFAAALIVTAFLFSMFFDWGGSRLQYSEHSSRGGAPAGASDPCHEESRSATTSARQGGEELAPLEPEQEELLASDNALAPAELLGLNEGLEQLETPGLATGTATETTPKRSPAQQQQQQQSQSQSQSQSQIQPQPEHAPEKLVAPEKLSPSRRADLRSRPAVHFHWDAVPGAVAYKIEAWQLDGSKKVVLIDQQVQTKELYVEPRLDGNVYWTVAAVDAEGTVGEVAGPITIDLLTKDRATGLRTETTRPERQPAAKR